jgi:P-type Cu2+ transporter
MECHEHMIADYKRRFWVSLVLTIPIVVFTFYPQPYLIFALSSCVFFYGGWPFLTGLFQELRAKTPGMMTLIGLAISVAYIYSAVVVFGLKGKIFFWELSTLIDIMLLGHWIEMKSVLGAGKALEALVQLLPSTAHKLMPDGSIKDIPLKELSLGNKVLIKPGEKIPVDGDVIDGKSSVNESMLTGESMPVGKEKSSKVIGGSVNLEGSLTVEIKKMGKDSFLSQVIDMVRKAQESKSKTQNLANRAALWLTIIALASGLLTFLIWITQQDIGFALERSVTVMVITCPHALGLAIPLVVAVSTALAAQKGLLIRNRTAFETARNIQAVVFDKTGTLTEGKFGVTDVLTFDNANAEELLNYAGSIEIHSEHLIAKAIAERCKEKWPVDGFQAIPGKGAVGKVKGKEIKVVSPGFLKENNIAFKEPFQEQGKTVVFVLIDNQLKGAIALADIIRKESKEAIAALKKMGIRCMMLTGDNKLVGKWVADELQLDEYFAEVLPHEKAKKIQEVQQRGLTVAMVGDGVNDAPAIAAADVGVAIGAGTNIAIEVADIILVKSNPMDAVAILSLSRSTYRKMVQNLLWATGYNAIAIPLAAAFVYITPAVAAAVMSLSTVIVAINAKNLKG